jgi:hypothetical protein
MADKTTPNNAPTILGQISCVL